MVKNKKVELYHSLEEFAENNCKNAANSTFINTFAHYINDLINETDKQIESSSCRAE
jgi:hypothetical protein